MLILDVRARQLDGLGAWVTEFEASHGSISFWARDVIDRDGLDVSTSGSPANPGEQMMDPAAVFDRETFLVFLRELAKDREIAAARERTRPSSSQGPDAGGWENTSIEAYLASCAAWAADRPVAGPPSWRGFAEVLLAGKLYE
ncbi:MAG: hypothetical protein IPK26_06545 [Planctomycetes bacterium]|nr:hypothetical protein [Planctomycetota bacterium]